MSKFGELIDGNIPVLLDFYTEWTEQASNTSETVRHVAAALGDKAKVIKIDVDKNKELAEALKIKGLPTFMIYKNGEMVWRQTGDFDANTLINKIKEVQI